MKPRGRPRLSARALAVVALSAVLTLAGCASSSGQDSTSSSTGETGTMTVLAASSLTEAFTTLAHDFEAVHPHVKVKLAFDSSATLAEQVNQGAPADVLATADTDTMNTVVDGGGTDGDPQVFATNHLVLAVPRDNPAHIQHFSDLSKPGVKYVVCVDTAPCGKLAAQVVAATHLTAQPASQEVDVKSVLTKVELGEADAGLVYASDVATAGGRVSRVDIPTSGPNLNSYPIAALSSARKPDLAKAWVTLVLSPQGQKVLADAGFGKP
jgi:molybdate transport system substrate-binding protein